MDNMIIEALQLRKEFPGTVALDDVDFDVRKGEVHALVGENGAGKSTLIKIISGVYAKTSGTLLFEGKKIEHINPRQAIDWGVSVIYQELENLAKLSVAENIFLGGLPRRKLGVFVDHRKLIRMTGSILEELALDLKPQQIVGTLTIAEQQLVEIAKAFSKNLKLLIMDEPTSYLNRRETERLFATINRIKAQGVSVIYVSHRLQEVLDISDRISVLRDGKKVATIADAKKMNEKEIIRLIIGHDILARDKADTDRGDVALEVRKLTIRRRLFDFSMQLHRGEILGIAGLTGSGKDELLKCLAGLWPPAAGAVFLFGKRSVIRNPNVAARRGMLYLPEERKAFSLFPTLNCRENISPIWLHRVYRRFLLLLKRERRIAGDYAKKLQVKTPSLEHRVVHLSGGNQQKLIFARLLAVKPGILLLHDPTRGIDVGSKDEIYEIMIQLAAQGTAIILLSSEIQEICNLAHRVIVIAHGRLAGEFTGKEVTMENVFAAASI